MISKDKCLCFPWITYRHLPRFGYIRPSISKLTYNLLLLVEILVRRLGRYSRKITTPPINNHLANREIVINFRGWLMRPCPFLNNWKFNQVDWVSFDKEASYTHIQNLGSGKWAPESFLRNRVHISYKKVFFLLFLFLLMYRDGTK